MRRWAIWSANVALFVLGCFLAAEIVVSVLAEIALPTDAEAVAAVPVAPNARQPAQERKAILDRNLFGARIAGQGLPDEADDEPLVATETKLPLELLGTVASNDESVSNAAIMDRGSRKHQVVFIGDQLEAHPQVEVVAIYRRTVILDNKGKRERLDLREDEGQPASRGPARGSSRRAAARPTRDAQRGSIAQRIEQLSKASGGRTTAGLYSQARIVPEWSEGEMVGVRLNQVKPGSLYEKIGIESGDVITTLNGISIDSPQASSRLLTEFTQAEEFTIELQGGEVIEVDSEQLSDMLGDEE
jgi:general secretion pathway protein C